MLSEIKRFDLVDADARRARLQDLSVALLESDHPPVTHLFYRCDDKQLKMLPWDAVRRLEHDHILVHDLDAGEVVAPDYPAGQQPQREVLLKRDVLDALIIDLENRRTTRANDLCLEQQDGQLLLCSADASGQAMLRRLTRGHLGAVQRANLFDWKYVEFLRGDPGAVRSGAGYRLRIRRLPPGEIAHLTDALPYLHAAELLILLPDPVAADTLEVMAPERQLQVFEELDEDQGVRLLDLMAPDIACDLIGRLLPETAQRCLNRMSRQQSARVLGLLRYPEATVGGIMTNDVISIAATMTAGEARAALRARLKEPDFIHFIYLVTADEVPVLTGVISLREFFLADDGRRLEEIMNPYVMTLDALEPAQEAAYKVLRSDLAALPVVGRDGQLLGAVTIDAAVAQVAPASWRAQSPRIFA